MTLPTVNASGFDSALSAVSDSISPTPANSGPNLLSGRRHHVYAPPTTFAATKPARVAALTPGLTRMSLAATTTAIAMPAATPVAARSAGARVGLACIAAVSRLYAAGG